MNENRRLTVHYTQLAPARPGSPLAEEWEFYRREAGRLLAEGNEGKHILIKGTTILGIWDTFDEAYAEGCKRFLHLRVPFMVHQILTEEPLLKSGYNKLCRN